MPAAIADHPCGGVAYHGPKLSIFRAVWAPGASIRVNCRATPAFVRIVRHVPHFFWQLRFTPVGFEALPAVLIQGSTQFLGIGKDFLFASGDNGRQWLANMVRPCGVPTRHRVELRRCALHLMIHVVTRGEPMLFVIWSRQ